MNIQTLTAADPDKMQAADPRTADRSTLKDIRDVNVDTMQAADLRTADRSTLKDIRDVNVDTKQPKKERMLDFIRQIENPYCYRHGDYVVKINFADTDVTLEERMLSYMRTKY